MTIAESRTPKARPSEAQARRPLLTARAVTAGLDVSREDRLAELDRLADLAARLVPLEKEACAAPGRVAAG